MQEKTETQKLPTDALVLLPQDHVRGALQAIITSATRVHLEQRQKDAEKQYRNVEHFEHMGRWQARREWSCKEVLRILNAVATDVKAQQVFYPGAKVEFTEQDGKVYMKIFSSGSGGFYEKEFSLWPAKVSSPINPRLSVKTPWASPTNMWKCMVARSASKLNLDEWIERKVNDLSQAWLEWIYSTYTDHMKTTGGSEHSKKSTEAWLNEAVPAWDKNSRMIINPDFINKIKSQLQQQNLEAIVFNAQSPEAQVGTRDALESTSSSAPVGEHASTSTSTGSETQVNRGEGDLEMQNSGGRAKVRRL